MQNLQNTNSARFIYGSETWAVTYRIEELHEPLFITKLVRINIHSAVLNFDKTHDGSCILNYREYSENGDLHSLKPLNTEFELN